MLEREPRFSDGGARQVGPAASINGERFGSGLDVATQFGIQFASSPVFANFQGTLDAAGSANPKLVVPAGSNDPALIGLTLTFAAVLGESGPYVDRATNAVTVVLGG
ncbi:MAG: hypothetical protein IT459_02040 [Planctomycetes bacterium]|nr:hypothetical protein [Planctomycetota bacterium]